MSEESKTSSEDVEAHAKKFHYAEDAEPPKEVGTSNESEESEADGEQDVEAHAKRFH